MNKCAVFRRLTTLPSVPTLVLNVAEGFHAIINKQEDSWSTFLHNVLNPI